MGRTLDLYSLIHIPRGICYLKNMYPTAGRNLFKTVLFKLISTNMRLATLVHRD